MKITELATNEQHKRKIEEKARSDAAKDVFDLPYPDPVDHYQTEAMHEALNYVYIDAYHIRKLRLERAA